MHYAIIEAIIHYAIAEAIMHYTIIEAIMHYTIIEAIMQYNIDLNKFMYTSINNENMSFPSWRNNLKLCVAI